MNATFGRAETCPHGGRWPSWLPDAARHYLAHTEAGQPIRALARAADVHASTVLRQVRRYEVRREDPLVDAALRALAVSVSDRTRSKAEDSTMTSPQMTADPVDEAPMDETRLSREAMTALRHLAEPGALLAIAEGMELAVVVREDVDGQTSRCATVTRELAQAMALKDWIDSDSAAGRVARYRITAQGRAWLRASMAAGENSAQGFAEGQARFFGATEAGPRKMPVAPDSPLAMLARRRDKDGAPFLSRDLVSAGERLREDFELAQMGPRITQDWSRFLTAGSDQRAGAGGGDGASGARARLQAALTDLGPGLGDVALRCCCQLEGLESTEKRMGWSARSGKIVLRIALQHLARHYGAQGQGSAMIG